MSKKLVIVESPSKARTINKYLGKNFHVEATVGHIRNLPKSKLGVDVDDGFKPQMLNIRGKGDIIKKIKSLASKSDTIYIATDPDREGEAIAQDIAEVIGENNKGKINRVLFKEITKAAVQNSMNEPLKIDMELVASQRARRVMDRIIGYKISPFLWRKIIEYASYNLSAGRVQSVALRLICEREEEINSFIPVEYWTLWAIFKTETNETFKAKLIEIDGKSVRIALSADASETEQEEFTKNSISINNESEALKIVNSINSKKTFKLTDIVKKEIKRNPPPPFITSSLQTEASKKLRYSSKFTMGIAQSLYEGIDLGSEGTIGLITYMRTDSTRINPEIITDAREFIRQIKGEQYLPSVPRVFNSKSAVKIQDAHEAIRPTSIKYTPDFVKKYLNDKQFRLYELIWKRFIASQMSPAVFESSSVNVEADEFVFRATGSSLLFDGFLQMYEEQLEDYEKNEENGELKIPIGLKVDDPLKLEDLIKNQSFTKPPPRYSESSLIKELENKGIGRPSTYAGIVSTIIERRYVRTVDRKFEPTDVGRKVNDVLIENFPDIINVNFTARMETELDEIANGQNEYSAVLKGFYVPFVNDLGKLEKNIEKIKCDLCGAEMDIKIGRFGKFLACVNYPECKNIKSLKELSSENKEPEFTGEKCPKCEHGNLVYRYSKFGKFIGCERFPDCDYNRQVTIGVQCPKCGEGEITERKSRRGKTFFGCVRYPDCDFASWNKPIPQECPNGDSNYMLEKISKKKGVYLICPNCKEEILLEKEEQENE